MTATKIYDGFGHEIERNEAPRLTIAKILAFLLAMEKAVPPPEERHHNLAAMDDRLVLSIAQGRIWKTFFLDDGDLEKPTKQLVAEIVGLMQQQ